MIASYPGLTEAQWTAQVIKLAQVMGWRVAHFRPAQMRSGQWATAVQGDGVGFPDLVLCRGHAGIAAELKTDRAPKRIPVEQVEWLQAFQDAGFAAYVWRPAQLDEVSAILGAQGSPAG